MNKVICLAISGLFFGVGFCPPKPNPKQERPFRLTPMPVRPMPEGRPLTATPGPASKQRGSLAPMNNPPTLPSIDGPAESVPVLPWDRPPLDAHGGTVKDPATYAKYLNTGNAWGDDGWCYANVSLKRGVLFVSKNVNAKMLVNKQGDIAYGFDGQDVERQRFFELLDQHLNTERDFRDFTFKISEKSKEDLAVFVMDNIRLVHLKFAGQRVESQGVESQAEDPAAD